MNKQNSVNGSSAFWQKILLEGEIFRIARDFRKKIGMPILGFNYDEDWNKWREENIDKNKDWEKERIKNAHNFINRIKQKYPKHKGVMSDLNFSTILIEFYHFESVLQETFEKIPFSGFEVLRIKNRQRAFFSSLGIEDGIYIKINPRSSIDTIKKYIENNKPLIRNIQELFMHAENIPAYKKLKKHVNFRRDNLIMYLNVFNKKELEKFGFTGAYREMQIAKAMKEKYGYKNMTSEIVNIVIQRRRKMSKAMFGK